MGLRKESEKHLEMKKKETPFRKSSERENYSDKEFGESRSNNRSKAFKEDQFTNETPLRKESDNRYIQKEDGLKEDVKGAISKGVKSYTEELENDDYGIEATNEMTEKGYKFTKKSVTKLREFHSNRKENKLRKADEEQSKAFAENNINEFKPSEQKFKKADEEQIKSVKEKLGNAQKNKQQKPESKLTKGEKNNINAPKGKRNTFLKKVINKPKELGNSVKNKGIESYREALESDDDGVKVGSQGAKAVKEATKKVAHARKVQNKKGSAKKLKGQTTKLQTEGKLRKASISPKTKVSQKALQKKRIVRNSIYKNKVNTASKTASTLNSITQKASSQLVKGIRAVRTVVRLAVKKLVGTKVMGAVGAILLKLLPVFAVVGLVLGIVIVVMAIGGGGGQEMENQRIADFQTLDPAVEQWRDLVTEVAEEQGMTDYIGLALAIIQVESGGTGTRDIMQSSESAGYPRNYFQTERESVEQGISYLKSIVSMLGGSNSEYATNVKLIAQAYNFGAGFASYVVGNGGDYTLEVAEAYSRDVVAPALGNITGATYPYVNSVSQSVGKTYLYRNGGNFLYGELIGQYLTPVGDGEMYPPVEPMIVTSHFGLRQSPGGIGSTNHKGIDFDCTGGVTPIRSLMGGTVVKSSAVGGLGNTVIVQHENMYTTYGHMSSISVQNGQTVTAGEQLGICGSTGNSTGAHLHLEISPQPHQNQVDPYPYLQHLIGG
jgi:murein DD-endopeptidase MepM/ murein hydrolase activator NlpD